VPKNYEKGDKLLVMAGSIHSSKIVFPFHYYALPWCTHEFEEIREGKTAPVEEGEGPWTHTPYIYTFDLNSTGMICEKNFTQS
jgi:hypothetical protein